MNPERLHAPCYGYNLGEGIKVINAIWVQIRNSLTAFSSSSNL